MRSAQHDIHDVRKLHHYIWERNQHMLDPLVRRKQPERKQPFYPLHAKLILVILWGHEWYVGNAEWYEIDLGRWRLVNLLQDRLTTLRHDC